MSALTIRLDPMLETRLNRAALNAGLTKSEMVRQAIAEKVARTVDPTEQARLWAKAALKQAPEHDDFYEEI